MPQTIVPIPTYRCTHCNYSQDFQPTAENMQKHFNADKNFPLSDVQEGECPACGLKGSRGKPMAKETDPAKKCKVAIMGEEEVDALEVESGAFTEETEEVDTGKFVTIGGVQQPIKETRTNRKPVMRKLTSEEKAAKKAEIRETVAYWKAREDK